MSDPVNAAAAAPAALSAFLRGVERRGALFAELQCGDRDAADTALSAAMRAFRNHAAALPMADWPQRFWTLLVATPQLRTTAALAQWPRDLRMLASLEPAPRQALLLRLAAGLGEDAAAVVLAVSPEAYQHALAQACPRDADGQIDAQAWRTLAEAIQQQLRDLPPERLARVARLREEAINATRMARPAPVKTVATASPAPAPKSRPRWPWVALVLALCAAALAATLWWPQPPGAPGIETPQAEVSGRVQPTPPIETEALPDSAPASRFDAQTGVLGHPDFELLLDQDEVAVARDADFYAWYAAGAGQLPETTGENPLPDSATEPRTDAAETADDQL